MRLNKDVEHPTDILQLQSPFVREVVNGVCIKESLGLKKLQ